MHVHVSVQHRRVGYILSGLLRLPDAFVELPQTEPTVGDKRTHAVQLGESQSPLVVSCAAFSIKLFWTGR
jgi:hypothetical protein